MTILTADTSLKIWGTLNRRTYNKYSHILDLYHKTRAHWDGRKSRSGGYHISALAPDGVTRTAATANLRVRQYPLTAPYFSRTYIAMLPPTHLGASDLDYRFYDGNRLNVIPGRIALYYAPSGGYSRYPSRQSDGMELLTWHPSGECIVNRDALLYYNLGALSRVECFAALNVFSYRLERWIKPNRQPLGKSVPCSSGEPGAYRVWDYSKREFADPPKYTRWERNFNSCCRWDETVRASSAHLLIPGDRRKGLFEIRGDRGPRSVASREAGKLTTYRQWVAARARAAALRRKVRTAVNSVRRDPEMVAYLATLTNEVLDSREMARVVTNSDGTVSDRTDYNRIAAAKEVEDAMQSWSEASEVGDRQARFLQLGEYNDE